MELTTPFYRVDPFVDETLSDPEEKFLIKTSIYFLSQSNYALAI
jgi:hypothetical protein